MKEREFYASERALKELQKDGITASYLDDHVFDMEHQSSKYQLVQNDMNDYSILMKDENVDDISSYYPISDKENEMSKILQEAKTSLKPHYKDKYIHLGYSDIGCLILVGITADSRKEKDGWFTLKPINFGGDGEYGAWLIDETVEVPEHYHLEFELKSWCKIYDDETLKATFHAEQINIYTAGDYGCLIQLINKKDDLCKYE